MRASDPRLLTCGVNINIHREFLDELQLGITYGIPSSPSVPSLQDGFLVSSRIYTFSHAYSVHIVNKLINEFVLVLVVPTGTNSKSIKVGT